MLKKKKPPVTSHTERADLEDLVNYPKEQVKTNEDNSKVIEPISLIRNNLMQQRIVRMHK